MITIVALLTIRDEEAFEQFETQAIAIMKNYGGSLDTAFRPQGSATEQRVDEIHVLKFPDLEAFEGYRADETLSSLAALRSRAISESAVYVSDQQRSYASD